MKPNTPTATGLIVGVLLIGVWAAPANAEALDPQVVHALEAVPGGIVVDTSTVVWPDLGMTLEVISERSRSVGTCPTGAHCAFALSGLLGSRLTWTSCLPTHTVSALSSVGSIANARTGVTTRAHSASGGVLGIAPSGGYANVSSGTSYISCATGGIS